MGHGHMPVRPLTIAFSVSSQVQANNKPDPRATAGVAMILGVQSVTFHGKSRSCVFLPACPVLSRQLAKLIVFS